MATRPRGWLPWLVVGLVLVSALAFVGWRWSAWPLFQRDTSLRLAITLPSDLPLAAPGRVSPAHDRPALALSRDGRWLAYVCQSGETTRLCLRDMEAGAVTPVSATEGAHTPFFSPDGAEIGYFADRMLKKVGRPGGTPTVLADAPNPWGAVWGPDGLIYFNRDEGEGIYSVPAVGGAVRIVVPTNAVMPELRDRGVFLGGGFFVRATGQTPQQVIPGAGLVRHLAERYLVYAAGASIAAVEFDPVSAGPSGPVLSLASGLRTANYAVAQFAVSEQGTLVYVPGVPQSRTSFVWVDRSGARTPLGLPENDYHAYALSPDATRLAFGRGSGIWVQPLGAGGPPVRISPREPTGLPALNVFPRWSPDGRRLYYLSRPADAPARLMSAAADASKPPVEIWREGSGGPSRLYPMTFSPDGRQFCVFGPNGAQGYDIFEMRTNAEGDVAPGTPLTPLLGGHLAQAFGQVSPDGRWLLFMSNATGVHEVYVTSYPRPGAVHRVSAGGGREPMWNPSRPEIVYLSGTSVYGVEYKPGPEWNAGEPQLLFSGPFPDTPGFGYAMSPDGRFLLLENAQFLEPATTLNVITNVPGEVRRQIRETRR